MLSRLTPYTEKLLGIINVGCDVTSQLLIVLFCTLQIRDKNGNIMKQCITYL